MGQRERVHRAAAKVASKTTNGQSAASRAVAPKTQRVMALQRAAGNRATQAAVQRDARSANVGMDPRKLAMMGNKPKQDQIIRDQQQKQAEQVERENAEKKRKADEFNAASATIQSDPRYQQMQAEASSYTAKFLDVVSSALKGAMASAWEEGDKADAYEGGSAGIFAGSSSTLDAYMEENDEAYGLGLEMGTSHRAKQEEQEGQMALDMAGKIIPGGGGMIASAAKTGAKALAGQAIKAKKATETIKVNKVLMRYLLGTPAKSPEGPLQEKYEAARLVVAARYGSHLRDFAKIEQIDSETLPDFKFAMEETQSEVDSETDWDNIPTRGRS